MNRAFFNGVSGAKTHQFGIDTWAHNIANINTPGYKANRPEFATLFSDHLAQTSSPNPVESDQGYGVRANSSAIMLDQGSVVQTDRKLDVAILGEGWFGVTSSDGEQVLYTRNGNFYYDKNGDIVSSEGGYLMGVLAKEVKGGHLADIVPDVSLDSTGAQEPLKLPKDLILGAVATKRVFLHGNLGVEGVTGKFSTTVYTKEGKVNTLDIRIEKDLEQPDEGTQWTLKAKIKNREGKVLFEAEPTPIVFNGKGAIKSFTPPYIDNEGSPIKLDLGKEYDGLVSLWGNFIGKDIQRDGVPQGRLLHYHIREDGNIMANFDNGRSSSVGKIALYHFVNDQGLQKVGDNRFAASPNSGDPIFYTNDEGEPILGTKLMPYALEKSNTSTAEALTQLIIMQKAFDANAKSITTGDQLIQEALRMI